MSSTLHSLACLGNCTGHGQCVNDQCVCDAGYAFPDCGLARSDALFRGYEAFRWIIMVSLFSIAIADAVIIFRTKIRAFSHNANTGDDSSGATLCKRMLADPQLNVVTLLFISSVLMAVAWIDHLDAEGVFSTTSLHQMTTAFYFCAETILIFAFARSLHVFMSIYARVHKPTQQAVRALAVFTIIYAVAFAIGLAAMVQTHNAAVIGLVIINVCDFVYIVVLISGISAYSISILKPPAHAQSTQETEARQKIIVVLRGTQIIGASIIPFAVWTVLDQTSHLAIICGDGAITLLFILAELGLTVIFGRTDRDRDRDRERDRDRNSSRDKQRDRDSVKGTHMNTVQRIQVNVASPPAHTRSLDDSDEKMKQGRDTDRDRDRDRDVTLMSTAIQIQTQTQTRADVDLDLEHTILADNGNRQMHVHTQNGTVGSVLPGSVND